MDSFEYISIFDFIANLLKELELPVSERNKYEGLQSRTFDLADSFKIEAENYIRDIKRCYADSFTSISDNRILEKIVEKGVPPEVYDDYNSNTVFKNNKDAVYYFVTEISATLLNHDVLLIASRKAEHMERFKYTHDILRNKGFSQLNSDQSVIDTGYILLPDLGTFGDENKINHTTTTYEKIKLKNLIVVSPENLKTKDGQSYEVRNLVPSAEDHLQDYPQDGKFIVAVSPIHKEWLLKDKPTIRFDRVTNTKEYLFNIEGVTDEALIINRVKAAYETAGKYGARILLFPEMYGTEGLSNDAERVLGFPTSPNVPLIVMPSWWHNNLNTAAVLDDALTPLFSQAKYSSFVKNKDEDSGSYTHAALEDLRNTEHIIYIYHIPKIGRFCVCICKDFLMDSYRRMLSESLEASFILIPAFSPQIDYFTSCMGDLAHTGTYGVLVNCCAAFVEEKAEDPAVGAISLTRAYRTNADLSNIKLLAPECSGNCGNEIDPCIFIITITNEGLVDIKHIYRI